MLGGINLQVLATDAEWRDFTKSQMNEKSSPSSSSRSSSSDSIQDQKIEALTERIRSQESQLSSSSDEKQKMRLISVIKLNKDLLQRYTRSASNTPVPIKRQASGKNVSMNFSENLTHEIERRVDLPALELWQQLHTLYNSMVSQSIANFPDPETQTTQLVDLLRSARNANEQRELILKTDEHGLSLIHLAAPYPADLIKIVNTLSLSDKLKGIHLLDHSGKSAWHYAALNQSGLEYLNSIDPNNTLKSIKHADQNNMTVLHHAASNELASEFLLNLYPENERQAAILLKDSHGLTVLHHAALKHSEYKSVGSNVDAITFLLSHFPAESRLNLLTQVDASKMSVLDYVVKETPSDLLENTLIRISATLPDEHQKTVMNYYQPPAAPPQPK